MKKLSVIAAGGILLLTLAGCSAPVSNSTSTPDPEATSSQGATDPDYTFPEVDGECVDGTALVSADASSSIITIGDCENVVIEASNSKVIVGAVTNLTVNSSISLVVAASVEHITFGGEGNRVVTSGEPVVEGDLESNTVNAE
ncbi:MAG TPA: hypothetical protein VNJ54_18425 [Plantibacter sp.]|uniref:hypothetical protein n=1 Tax=unclassified Plantibacter TaxID=2624265 RepID=UPI002C41B263|nr:hypothetical protein [Plantibacter sp.]